MTGLDVVRGPVGIRVGSPPARPERTAVLEAAGATLTWDVTTTDAAPSALVWDVSRAVEWLWEVYGADAASAIIAGAGPIVAVPGDVTRTTHAVAVAGWARAWWPASFVAGVPALDPRLLAAEAVVGFADVEHLVDDEDTVERALADAVGSLEVLEALTRMRPEAAPLLDRVVGIAEDHGVDLSTAHVASRSDYALAAGGEEETAAVPVASGSDVLDLALLPPGSVDAAGEATWRIIRRDGTTVLEASVPCAPVAPGPPPTAP